MRTLLGSRDARTGRVSGFQSEAQRENFLAARARFSNGPNRQMPRCSALNRLGEPCKAARMRGRSTCFRHSGRLRPNARGWWRHTFPETSTASSAPRCEQNATGCASLWRRDPREPGRTIMLIAADEATCRAWAARQGFQLDVLDRDLPAFADACRWIWARMSRGLISDDDLTAKLARLRNRIAEASRAFDHSG